MLIVVEHRDREGLTQPRLDLEATWRGDVLEVVEVHLRDGKAVQLGPLGVGRVERHVVPLAAPTPLSGGAGRAAACAAWR